jgi:hypothetical protein
MVTRKKKKLEKPAKISKAENSFVVHVVSAISHILHYIPISRQNMMAKFLKVLFEEKMERLRKEADLKTYPFFLK